MEQGAGFSVRFGGCPRVLATPTRKATKHAPEERRTCAAAARVQFGAVGFARVRYLCSEDIGGGTYFAGVGGRAQVIFSRALYVQTLGKE